MANIRVTKASSVKSIQKQFKQDFNCTLVIYSSNNQIADEDAKIHEIAKDYFQGGDLEGLGKRSRVGNVEDYFKKSFGLKVQIKNAEGTKLADNEMTLNQAGNM